VGAIRTEVHTRRPFRAAEEDVAGWHVVSVTGEVDGETAGLLSTLVSTAVRRGARQVCLDFSELGRAGGGTGDALRRAQHAAGHAGGRLAVIRPGDPGVAKVLDNASLPGEVRVLARREQLGAGA